MQHEVHTHGIDMAALGRQKQGLNLAEETVALEVPGLNLFYGDKQALFDVSMNIPKQRVTAFIGPSGCGKSTLLRTFNRMNDLVDGCRVDGQILLDGHNIYQKGLDVAELRRRVGMVFQKPNPFPKSIYENVVYGLRIQGVNQKRVLDETVEWALKSAALWDEVKDRLHESALGLSGGQQQRLVIARTVAVQPEVLLLDEPTVGLDPASRIGVRSLLGELAEDRTVIVSTHLLEDLQEFVSQLAVLSEGELIFEGSYSDLESVGQKHPVRNANDAEAGYLTLLGEAA